MTERSRIAPFPTGSGLAGAPAWPAVPEAVRRQATNARVARPAPPPQRTPGKLRFGILCHGTRIPAWQAACIRQLLACENAEAALVIVVPPETDARGASRERATLARALLRLYAGLCIRPRTQAWRATEISVELAGVSKLVCGRPRRAAGDAAALPAADVAAIREFALDFILNCAIPDLGGDVLDAARLGVWFYDHGALDGNAEFACFWGLRRGSAAHKARLVALDRCGSGAVRLLHEGWFRTERSCAKTLDAVLFGSADWCSRACREIALGSAARTLGSAIARGETRLPRAADTLALFGRRGLALLRGCLRHGLMLEYWNVGIADAPIDDIIAAGRPMAVRWLPDPPALHYHADPFTLPDRPDIVLVETYSQVAGEGWIAWLSASDPTARPHRIAALGGSTHRSYPFLFALGEDIFCIPESAGERRVRLYKAVSFPAEWQAVTTLIDDFPGLDSTVFLHAGHYWLFCTSGDPGGAYKLYAWHAEELCGPWRPHALNPLKCDVASTRPAGPVFRSGGGLYRPAQDGTRTYGGAVTINRILSLTPTEFSEEPAGRIEPARDGRYRAGIHTVCPVGGRTVIDGKRFTLDPRAPYLRVRAALARRRARGAAGGAGAAPRPAGR